MTSPHPAVSDAELQVLKVLWEQGPGTVRGLLGILQEQGQNWAYTTVQTLLQRLQVKGYVASDKSGLAHVFRATVTRDDLLQRRLGELAEQLCEGTATPLVQALVGGQHFTPEDITHFRKLLDQLESQSNKKR